ncbi:MAG: hypothetical protein PW845_24350 [Pseudomonas sp.]|uniref:hypothetical protein n=1 Tax=Pseudomonas abieticivorans TaxID=2931382 RepID=UPI0020BE3BBB|nr:hypothetical protein [Pseudomonas sp. PIA16]MDE1168425.1 hypothetical protein [Pseudomonas sp.]
MTATTLPDHNGPASAPFRWNFKGRVIAIDNGATLARRPDFKTLMALDALSVITFDPASRLHGLPAPSDHAQFQLFSGVTLGDGNPVRLHACLDPELSATRAPLAAALLPTPLQNAAQVLARITLNSLQLDRIEGLKSVDWLVLDDRHDSLAILQHARAAMRNVLLAQVRTSFAATHEGGPDFTQLCQHMAEQGLSFYRFHEPSHLSHFPTGLKLDNPRASHLQSADALFIPDRARLAQLEPQRRLKLAFILDSAYGLHDLAYPLIAAVDDNQAYAYLSARHYLHQAADPATTFTLTAQYSPAPW